MNNRVWRVNNALTRWRSSGRVDVQPENQAVEGVSGKTGWATEQLKRAATATSLRSVQREAERVAHRGKSEGKIGRVHSSSQSPIDQPNLVDLEEKEGQKGGEQPGLNPFVVRRLSAVEGLDQTEVDAASTVGWERTEAEETRKFVREVVDRRWRYCSGVREHCRRIIVRRNFEVGIMALIFTSALTLVASSPLDDPSTAKTKVLHLVDWVFTALFSFEMVLKVSRGWHLPDPPDKDCGTQCAEQTETL